MADTFTKAEQSDRTRTALLNAARRLFGEQGYVATSTQDIVESLGVTRGALYYHFGNKAGLFRAVFEELRASRLQMVLERTQMAEGDLWQRLVQAGSRAYLEGASDRETQRILYIDGPAVLPMRVWRDNSAAHAALQYALEQLATGGLIKRQPFGVLARLLWGAILEAGLLIAHADDREATQQEVLRDLEQLFAGLRLKPDA